jgi:hypothetical protein
VDSAHVPTPQLGRILIAAGLLTESQLELALEEQARTSRRLGEIIVQRGFVSGPAIANALAEQHGGVLKTEYGYATGLGGEVVKRAASENESPIPRLRTVEVAPTEPEPQAEVEPAPPPGPTAEQVPEPEPVPDPAPEPVPEPVPEPAPPPAPSAEQLPAPELDPAPEPPPEPVPEPAPEPLPPPAAEQPAEPPPGRDDRDELIESLRARLDVQEAELIALREAVARERLAEEPQAQPDQEDLHETRAAEPAPPPESTPTPVQKEHYLLCVPTSTGYVLLDRHGGVPNVGEEVDVPEEEGTFSVTKVVRLPRNGRLCAYLQRDRPAD